MLCKFKKRVYFNLNLNDWIQRQMFFLDEYEDFELKAVEEILEKGDVCIDVGANFGLYSLWCASIVGEKGEVISIEPYEENYKELESNIRLNKLSNIRVVKKAVSDKEAPIKLYYNTEELNLGMVSSYNFNNNNPTTVDAIAIDKSFLIDQIKSLKFIKIDIEGGEYLALKGMINLLKKFKPIVQIEIDDEILKKTPFRRTDIFDFFKNIDYELYMPTLHNNKLVQPDYSKNHYFRSKTQ